MHHHLSSDHQEIRDLVARLCQPFDDDYWLERDRERRLPVRLLPGAGRGRLARHRACAEAHGGAGLGITEAAVMMQAIAESGGGMAGASAVHINIFGLQPVAVFGTDEQKAAHAPAAGRGPREGLLRRHRARCRARHHPASRLRAEQRGDRYVVNGQKIWISDRAGGRQDPAARPHDAARGGRRSRRADSRSSIRELDRDRVEVREIEKMGRKAVDSNWLFFDDFEIPADDRIGEEGRGFHYILHGLNPERILIAAEAVGLGRAALGTAVGYARERVVFDRPIGQNQASSTRWPSAGSSWRRPG